MILGIGGHIIANLRSAGDGYPSVLDTGGGEVATVAVCCLYVINYLWNKAAKIYALAKPT